MARIVLVIDLFDVDPTITDPHTIAEELTGEVVGDRFAMPFGPAGDGCVESAEWED